jgi:hypothetical protein
MPRRVITEASRLPNPPNRAAEVVDLAADRPEKHLFL